MRSGGLKERKPCLGGLSATCVHERTQGPQTSKTPGMTANRYPEALKRHTSSVRLHCATPSR
jgi:hypothetical protein